MEFKVFLNTKRVAVFRWRDKAAGGGHRFFSVARIKNARAQRARLALRVQVLRNFYYIYFGKEQ